MLRALDRLVVHGPRGLIFLDDGDVVEIADSGVASYAVNPRSSRIAYSVLGDQGESLYVVDPSRHVSLVYEGRLAIGGLTWGPRESFLSFIEQPPDGIGRLRIVSLRSGETQSFAIMDEPHLAAEPSWSADGRWLGIEAQPTQYLRGMTVYVYNRNDASVTLVDPLDEPEPKSACPRFAPRAAVLVYTYTPVGVLDSQLRLLFPGTGRRESSEIVGLNDPRWSQDGQSVLAVRHRSICETDLVQVGIPSLKAETLLTSAGHLTPMYMDSDIALFVERPCSATDYIPTDPGDLLALSLASGHVDRVARSVYSASPVMPGRK